MDPVNPEEQNPIEPQPAPEREEFESEYDRNPLSFLVRPWFQKAAFWVLLLGVLMYLRSFFALIFLTFLFSILMEAVVQRTTNLIPSRKGRVVMVFLLLLASWAGLFYFMVPRVAVETIRAVEQLPKIAEGVQKELEELRPEEESESSDEADEADEAAATDDEEEAGVGEESGAGVGAKPENPAPAGEKARQPKGKEPDPSKPAATNSEAVKPGTSGPTDTSTAAEPAEEPEPSIWDIVIDAAVPLIKKVLSKERITEFLEKQNPTEVAGYVGTVVAHLLWAVTVFLLSLIFSFLIVWDFPRLVEGYYKLEKTRAGPFFQIARETFSPFGRVLAQALGAQTVIALVNTALTAIGMALLKIPSIEVLSVIVFLCSFIPVAGVFISSTPICFVALGNNGIGTMLLFIGVVTIVHMIEAYILNPRIYGAHLNMNPLVVLVLLVFAHHLLGLWGLLLATPVTAYVFHHVLVKPEDREGTLASDPDPPPDVT